MSHNAYAQFFLGAIYTGRRVKIISHRATTTSSVRDSTKQRFFVYLSGLNVKNFQKCPFFKKGKRMFVLIDLLETGCGIGSIYTAIKEKKADVNEKSFYGDTPLLYAIKSASSCSEWFPNIKGNRNDLTFLIDLIKLLVKNGADVNMANLVDAKHVCQGNPTEEEITLFTPLCHVVRGIFGTIESENRQLFEFYVQVLLLIVRKGIDTKMMDALSSQLMELGEYDECILIDEILKERDAHPKYTWNKVVKKAVKEFVKSKPDNNLSHFGEVIKKFEAS